MTYFPPGMLLILPSRLAVDRERVRILRAHADGVVLDPRIYTFGRLEMELSQTLGPGQPVISELARDMLLARVIEQEQRRSGWPRRPAGPGLGRQVADLLDELKTGGIDPEPLTAIASDGPTQSKAHWLHRVYVDYEQALDTLGFADRAAVRRSILNKVAANEENPLLKNVNEVVVRDFNRLTPFQLELTIALARLVERVSLDLILPEWILNAQHVTEALPAWNPFQEDLWLLKRLESFGDELPSLELHLRTPVRKDDEHGGLTWLKRSLFQPTLDPDQAPGQPNGVIDIVAAPGRYAEVEQIGRRIWSLIDQGVAPARIAVAADLGRYGSLLEDVFRRYRIPLFFRRGEPLAIQIPARTVLSLLRLAASNWDRDRVVDLAASPYLDLGFEVPWQRLAELSARAGVTDERAGGGWDNLRRVLTGAEDAADASRILDGVRRLKTLLAPLSRPQTWPEFIRWILALLIQLGLDQRIMASSGRFLYRDAPAWAALQVCLADLEKAARDAGLESDVQPPETLLRGVQRALEGRNIGTRSQPGGVMVLSPYDLHGLDFDYVFLAGMNEGEFPQPHPEGLLLRDGERTAINRQAGRRVLKTTAMDYQQQELLFYHALSSAHQGVVMSYSRTDEAGRLRLPSALLDEVRRLWPVESFPTQNLPVQVTSPLLQAMTREDLMGALARDLFQPQGEDAVPMAQEVLSGLLEEREEDRRWSTVIHRVRMEHLNGQGMEVGLNGRIASERLAPWLAGLRMHEQAPLLSPTFLERYARCPFQFWGQQVLALDPVPEPTDEMNPMDEGSILHQILNHFLARCRDAGALPLSGDVRESIWLESVAEQVWSQAEQRYPMGRRPLWLIRRRAMKRILKRWLSYEQSRGFDYVPKHFEWSFGPRSHQASNGTALETPLTSGGRLFFLGRIDRIDLSPDAALVMDYKNSGNKSKYAKMLKEEELGRTSFQAPVYQSVVAEAFGRPAQATFVLLRQPEGIKPTPSTASDFFERDLDRRREMLQNESANFFNRVEAVWGRLVEGDLAPRPETGECDYCPFRVGCRASVEAGS